MINSKLFKGQLNYGELLIKGKSKKEILFSTNICHPSLANNEISGPVLAMKIGKHILEKKRDYTYRIIFIPETIGAIAFISKNLQNLKIKFENIQKNENPLKAIRKKTSLFLQL